MTKEQMLAVVAAAVSGICANPARVEATPEAVADEALLIAYALADRLEEADEEVRKSA
jgi:hypothetical protein